MLVSVVVLQMSEKISQYARYLFEEVDNNWSLVHEDGEMKVYRREMEDGGVVVDPLKSYCTATVSLNFSHNLTIYCINNLWPLSLLLSSLSSGCYRTSVLVLLIM